MAVGEGDSGVGSRGNSGTDARDDFPINSRGDQCQRFFSASPEYEWIAGLEPTNNFSSSGLFDQQATYVGLGNGSLAPALAGVDQLDALPAVSQYLRIDQMVIDDYIASIDGGSRLQGQKAWIAGAGAYQEHLTSRYLVKSLLIGRSDFHRIFLQYKMKTHHLREAGGGFWITKT